MQAHAARAPDSIGVVVWRREQLVQSGWRSLAARLAKDTRYDLHALIRAGRARVPASARGPDLAPLEATRGVSALRPATVRSGLVQQETPLPTAATPTAPLLDAESQEWLRSLRAEGADRDDAAARLHAFLLRAARFEVARRRHTLPHLRGDDLDDLALQAADDPGRVLAGSQLRARAAFDLGLPVSLLEAAVKLRSVPGKAEIRSSPSMSLSRAGARAGPGGRQGERLATVRGAITDILTPPSGACSSPWPPECRSPCSPTGSHSAARAIRPARRPAAAPKHLEPVAFPPNLTGDR